VHRGQWGDGMGERMIGENFNSERHTWNIRTETHTTTARHNRDDKRRQYTAVHRHNIVQLQYSTVSRAIAAVVQVHGTVGDPIGACLKYGSCGTNG